MHGAHVVHALRSVGFSEVIVESPNHEDATAEMPPAQLEDVLLVPLFLEDRNLLK